MVTTTCPKCSHDEIVPQELVEELEVYCPKCNSVMETQHG